jgi:hypothetical protein
MLNARLEAAVAIRKELRPTEDAVDQTLGQLGMLIHTTCAARIRANAPAHLGQEAIDELATAAAMLSSVRGKIIAAHAGLADVHRELLPTVGAGVDGCPPQKAHLETAPAALRSVA